MEELVLGPPGKCAIGVRLTRSVQAKHELSRDIVRKSLESAEEKTSKRIEKPAVRIPTIRANPGRSRASTGNPSWP